jgi:hypothetical protein
MQARHMEHWCWEIKINRIQHRMNFSEISNFANLARSG